MQTEHEGASPNAVTAAIAQVADEAHELATEAKDAAESAGNTADAALDTAKDAATEPATEAEISVPDPLAELRERLAHAEGRLDGHDGQLAGLLTVPTSESDPEPEPNPEPEPKEDEVIEVETEPELEPEKEKGKKDGGTSDQRRGRHFRHRKH